MRTADLIIKKRGSSNLESQPLTQEEIKFLIDGYVNGSIPDYQMSAFLMSVFFKGMTFEETSYLTNAMLHSGEVINLYDMQKKYPSLKGPFVDKHSTGGVGDKISLPLAAIAAACGVQIPMMSGRGLGHTGGTLDKLESIEGYNVNLNPDDFARIISQCGFAMMGQTPSIAPADKKMYALRDVTGTVESIPLITSSILSKKVAEGSDALVFDIKCGSGAFMKNEKDAEALALFLVNTAKAMGKKAVALLTRMDTPLGFKTGNYLEIEESIECLLGKGPDDVMEITYALASRMLLLAEKAKSEEEALRLCKDAVKSGAALKKFLENVNLQGGDAEKLMGQIGKRRSSFCKKFIADESGYLKIEAYKTGIACINLGVGRNKASDSVDADSGIIFMKRQGDYVNKGEVIMEVYAKDQTSLESGIVSLKGALSYSAEKNQNQNEKLIIKEIK